MALADSDVRKRPGQSPGKSWPGLDLVVSKLRRPPIRPGAVRRESLIEKLARDDRYPIVSVVAPAGYGKTTLLSQWAECAGQACAWVSVDETDNDPKVLLAYIAEALNAVEPIGQRVFDALASPASSVPGSVLPRLGSAFSEMISPVLLVVDDVHLLHNAECRAALSVLADHVPDGSRLVFAGRDQPPLRVARLRSQGKILEIGLGELSLTRSEAASLLRNVDLALAEDDVAELYLRTEGWAAGLYLAALYLREGGALPDAVISFGGQDRLVAEYVESEFLERISRQQREFLTRAAVLERLSGPLCEAVLDRPGSGTTLADLAMSNLLLVPLDRHGEWYRYHHLFRDMLLADLERQAPSLVPVLRRRAATWYLENDLPEEALEYAMAAGDTDTAAHLVERLAVPVRRQGRTATLRRWFGWLEEQGGVERYPMVTVLAALIYAWMGRPAEAERWAEVVDRWRYDGADRPDTAAVRAWAALARAMLCRRGIEQMLADADEAARRFAAENVVTAGPAFLQGIARFLAGDPDEADACLHEAVSVGETTGAYEIAAAALSERSLMAMARGQWDRAEALACQAPGVLHQAGDSYVTPLICAAQARVALHRGDLAAVHEQLATARRLRPLQTYAVPHVAVQAHIELIRVHLELADLAGARTLMREVDELLARRPGLGILAGEARTLRARLSKERGVSVAGVSALTAAELRLVPLLSTHLSVPEIAVEMSLSPHTIKSQMRSIYRKLDASTRNQAVTRTRELGLLEG